MSRTPIWVWKQRCAVTGFLVGFYVRRLLRSVRMAVAPLPPARNPSDQKPFPRRRRPAPVQS